MTQDTLGSRIRRGLAWKAGSQVTLQISRTVVALFIARLLTPHDWGLAAMVIAFGGLVALFTDNALGTALVQRRRLLEGDRSTVFWLNVGIGVVLTLAGILLAAPVAKLYGEPAVAPLFAVFSITFLMRSLGTTQAALLTRSMQFRNLELPAMSASIAGAVAGITMALADFGAWAIIGQQVVEAATSTVLLWYFSPWRPSMRFSTASLRRLGSFAANVFGENLVSQANATSSTVLMGRVLGAASLGTYTLASSVVLMPFWRIAVPLQQVFFPAFSRLNDDRERLAAMWIRASRFVGFISFPSLVGLAIVAPDFVQFVLGPKWSGATPVIQILASAGLVLSLQTLSGEALLALGRARTLFRFTVFAVVVSLSALALALGLQWGIVGVATTALVATLLSQSILAYITTRALSVPVWTFVSAFSGVAQATAVMAATVFTAREAFIGLGIPVGARLVLLIAIGAAVYAAVCLWRVPEVMQEIRNASERRRTKALTSATPVEAGP